MDLTPFAESSEEDRENRAAETFARYVHDTWGVGEETECGGAGVLLFLSIEDRAVYISKGSALESTLTNSRLDQVIENMKDLLRSEEYDSAILRGLEDIKYYVEKGPPTFWEKLLIAFINFLFPMVWLLVVLGTMFKRMWDNSRMKRDYARVKSQLNEIDRARAEALQGKYKCTSCPICLEDFPVTEGEVATTGSDGEPIKLLRCGHCMDETCWAEWVSSGQGTITKCPICMEDICGESTANNTANLQQQQQRAPIRRRAPNDDRVQNVFDDNIQHDQNFNNNDEDRLVRQYRRERNFRLARLGARYPQLIRQTQIQRWSQPGYDGALVRDPTFVQSNPSLVSHAPSGTSGGRFGGGGGFGGSSSGGGRGGRW